MPLKKDQHTDRSTRIIRLLLLLLFTGRRYWLPDLARRFDCSKQTVVKMMEQIGGTREVEILKGMEGRKRWYQLKTMRPMSKVEITPEQLQLLGLCRDLVGHILPESKRQEVDKALMRTVALLPDPGQRDTAFLPTCQPIVKGAIDYTPFQAIIATLLSCIREKQVCQLKYQAPHHSMPKHYSFAPLTLLSYRDALYVTGWWVKYGGNPKPILRLTFCVHRMQEAEATEHHFEVPGLEDDPQRFGFMEGQPFRVKINFSAQAAQYVKERRWSNDQTIKKLRDGRLRLEFTAQSWLEVVSWVLSFGSQAKVISPKQLKNDLIDELNNILANYIL